MIGNHCLKMMNSIAMPLASLPDGKVIICISIHQKNDLANKCMPLMKYIQKLAFE